MMHSVGQHARYADPEASRGARLTGLVLRGLCGASLLAATLGLAFAPMLVAPDEMLADDLGSGIGCAAGAVGLALLVAVLQRFPNVPGTALVGVVAGKLIVLMILLAPVTILGALGGEDGEVWGLFLGLLILGGLLVYHLARKGPRNRHSASLSDGVPAGAGAVGVSADGGSDFGGSDGGDC